MMENFIQISALLTIALLTPACSRGALTVNDAWARPALAGNNSAVYFVIDNPAREDDTLLGISTNATGTAEMHMTMAVEGENTMEHDMGDMPQREVMTMVKQEKVHVPGQGEVTFEPGGLHVMLVGINTDLAVGDTIELTLTFEKAGTITLQVPVMDK